MNWSADPVRLWSAAAIVAVYLVMCVVIWLGVRRQQLHDRAEAAKLVPARDGAAPILVVFATQTGYAEELAWHTGKLLHTAGEPVQVLPMRSVDAATLANAQRALFIVSTYGEGDPPDMAAPFVNRVMQADPDLPRLQYAVLALGDESYVNYCGFGRMLDAWLAGRGAKTLFERVEVNSADAHAITRWHHQLSHIANLDDMPVWQAPDWQYWTLQAREQINTGSSGRPVFHIELQAPAGEAAHWESGDLVQVSAPADPDHPREYSIGSVAADGRVHLLVRQELREDGTLGVASGWLTHGLALAGELKMRLRPHRNFRLEDNIGKPLILIGNGTGLAGLRSHLKARAAAGQKDNWLVFGERNAAHDYLYRADIESWRQQGILADVDMVFSRDQPEKVYVQDRLLAKADEVRQWLARGAAVYVCGSLEGMAGGVDAALRTIATDDIMDAMAAEGRYRRDVY
jgi:sulfite reductase (NADPH) flavoprotein alpha-component